MSATFWLPLFGGMMIGGALGFLACAMLIMGRD